MRTIIIQERTTDYGVIDFFASFEDAPDQWGVGANVKEAIGDLVRTYGEFKFVRKAR